MGLTLPDVKALEWDAAGPSQQVQWDGDLPGFGVRVFPTGKKSFVLSYRNRAGRARLFTLGRFGVLTLHQARKMAKQELARVRLGADPIAERKQERSEARKADSVKAFAAVYVELHAKPHRRSWKEDQRRLEKYILPILGRRRLEEVLRSDVEALHARIGTEAATEANRVVQLLRLVFNKGIAWGHLPPGSENPAAMDRRGDHGVKAFRERSRTRWVTPAEMPRLLEAIGGEDNVFIRAAFRLYLLVPLRKLELLRARWEHIDFRAREWRVPHTKSGEPHVVPLSSPALAILEALPRLAGNPHVFPGHKHGSHLVNIDKNWRAVRERAGCPDIRIHDLRRSVGSWMANSGVSLQVIGQVLGHAPGDVQATAIYARLQRDAARDALEAHGAALLGATEPPDRERRIRELEAELARLREVEGAHG